MQVLSQVKHSLQLLKSVHNHLDTFRNEIAVPPLAHNINQRPDLVTGLASEGNHSLTTSAHYLYSAIHNIAHHLSSTSQNGPDASPLFTSNLTSILSDSLLGPSLSALDAPGSSSLASSTWHSQIPITSLIDDLPMPTDEASMNNELGLGPVRDPLWTAIPMTVLYILILVTGVIGNGVTCAVIARNRYMHTATNYYLFSLAISDLMLLVLGLPQEIWQIWRRYPYVFGEVFCVLRGYTSEASTNSSVLTITAFTIERYVAICHPLKAHTMSKLSRAIKLIIVIWILGFLCAAPIAYQFGIVFDYVHGEVVIPQSATCNIKRPVPYLEEHIFALQSLLVFVVPVTLISVLYVLIGVKLRQSSRQSSSNSSSISPLMSKSCGGKFQYNCRANRRRRTIRRLQSIPNYSFTGSSMDSIEIIKPKCTASVDYDDSLSIASQPTLPHHSHHPQPQPCSPSSIESCSQHHANSSHNGSSTDLHFTPHHDKSHKESNIKPSSGKAHELPKSSLCNNGHVASSPHPAAVPSPPVEVNKRARLNKFTSSSTSVGSSGCTNSSLAQRRAVIKMLSKSNVATPIRG